MDRIARLKPGIVVAGLVGIVGAATIGAFVSFAPVLARPVYWLGLADVLAIEATTAFFYLSEFLASTGQRRRGVLPATRIAANATSAILALIGLTVDLLYLFRLGTPSYDRVFFWFIVARWVLLGILTLPMLLADTAYQESRAELTLVQQDRRALMESFDTTLASLRRIEPRNENQRELIRRLTDEGDSVRNRMRGLTSTIGSGDFGRLGQLVEQFGSQVDLCARAEPSARDAELASLQATSQQIAREVRGTAVARLG
jgi:hypothetical protein